MLSYMISAISTFILIPLLISVSGLVILRIISKKYNKEHPISKFYKTLKSVHIPLAKVLLVLSIIHAVTSSTGIFVINFGSAGLFFMILATICYITRRKIKRRWLLTHRTFATLSIIAIAIHVIYKI